MLGVGLRPQLGMNNLFEAGQGMQILESRKGLYAPGRISWCSLNQVHDMSPHLDVVVAVPAKL